MPYICQKRRAELAQAVEAIPTFDSPGELNYFITKAVLKCATPLNYATIAMLTGVLENVKTELYRRVAVPYEQEKLAENGDVF